MTNIICESTFIDLNDGSGDRDSALFWIDASGEKHIQITDSWNFKDQVREVFGDKAVIISHNEKDCSGVISC